MHRRAHETNRRISIHLMLWFNQGCEGIYQIPLVISIHLMLWFNIDVKRQIDMNFEFQYILCCGSTTLSTKNKHTKNYFNTSYVVVQRRLCCQFLSTLRNFNTSYVTVQHLKPCFSNKSFTISIHLMLRFNGSDGVMALMRRKISIHLMLRFNYYKTHRFLF